MLGAMDLCKSEIWLFCFHLVRLIWQNKCFIIMVFVWYANHQSWETNSNIQHYHIPLFISLHQVNEMNGLSHQHIILKTHIDTKRERRRRRYPTCFRKHLRWSSSIFRMVEIFFFFFSNLYFSASFGCTTVTSKFVFQLKEKVL